eukprot:GDKI01029473.1.p1 GENE.GDKI01029473.1~~GDKI01029473.1.p1  ORF type:complete len:201 (-),score=66.54 GDKI01029473.1:24-626(-)
MFSAAMTPAQKAAALAKVGDAAAAKMDKVNAELLALTYGSLVTQLLKDLEQVESVNEQLEKMGYNIGVRLVEELLAKCTSQLQGGSFNCQNFTDTCEVVARVAFKMFLGITVDTNHVSQDTCILVLSENPLAEFVEIPPQLSGLSYSNLMCGVIRGALEQVHLRVACTFVRDILKGDDTTEIKIELKEVMREEYIDEDDN